VLYAFHILIPVMEEVVKTMKDPVFVSPDLGFAKKARNYAAQLDLPLAFIEKRRSSNDPTAQALTMIGDVRGRDCFLMDEEISTGATIVTAINLMKEKGAEKIYLVFIHPVLAEGAAERLAALPVTGFITTDTIPMSAEKKAIFGDRLRIISVAELLAEVISRANQGRSVGEMFNE
jgi:ribose-phosphate pyrophosphokinase